MRTQRFLPLVFPLVGFLCAAGCKVTAADIDYWQGTVKGPGKLLAVLMSDKYATDLRTRAALALIEMEPRSKPERFDGIEEIQKALQNIEDKQLVEQIVDGMVPGLQALMRGEDQAQTGGTSRKAAPQQIRGKDAAFLLIPHGGAAARKGLAEAVVSWYVADFNGRSLAGTFSAEQVIRSLGSSAAAMLVDALSPDMPSGALVKIAELIGQLGDPVTRQVAAQRLVDLETRLESDAYLGELKERIKKQVQEAEPGVQVAEGRLTAAATMTRDNVVNEGALPALKYLAGESIVAERLLQVAEINASSEAMTERRKRALQALEGSAKREHLQRLQTLALNKSNPAAVRDYAFDRIGDIGSKDAIPPLWPLVQSADDQRLRWRAGELVLHLGGRDVVADFLARLPSGDETKFEPEELDGYATRFSQMTPPPTIVRAQLDSPHWGKRIIALRFLEKTGRNSDIASMRRFTRDTTAVHGEHWGEVRTVANVAETAIAALQERLRGAGGATRTP